MQLPDGKSSVSEVGADKDGADLHRARRLLVPPGDERRRDRAH